MVKYNLKNYLTAIIGLTISIFLGLSYFTEESLRNDIEIIINNLSTTITIVVMISTLFVLHGWKWKMFQGWLVPFPCLSGKWTGETTTVYNGEKMLIPTEAIITHNFFNIQVKIETNESSSTSFCGGFDIDKARGLNHLIYSYQSIPEVSVREQSVIHFGSVRAVINENATILKGEYWSSRKTVGSIELKKI